MFCFLSSQLTIRDRLGPARVRGRVIVHQIKVDLSHHGVQLSSLLPIAVSWEQLIYDGLSPDQVITDRGEKKSLGRYRNIDLSSQCFKGSERNEEAQTIPSQSLETQLLPPNSQQIATDRPGYTHTETNYKEKQMCCFSLTHLQMTGHYG